MIKSVLYAIGAVSLTAVLMTSGCGGSNSPGGAVKAAYTAANAGQYSEANKYMSSEALSVMGGTLGAFVGGLKGMWDRATREGTIDKVEIIKEEVRGEGATVIFRIHYKNGDTEKKSESMIKEDGKWKIAV